ncbi:efflux RND transporter permease subunit [Methylobacterium nonmethylotrophicum]|uniref:efflux RND transporter permease subunit n=1 Tax=Methylobacterium nonmethylotrophicum TaxID=1141884 RepID=UPI001436AD1C|nr:efflux RND transporter permease subunit [Methylobacterium nonmethylotrophicum]
MSILDFNLSHWAITNRSLVTFAMIVVIATGAWSFLRIGRAEDPPFTVKLMVIKTHWPGATTGDTIQQITDRIEKKMQEVRFLDHLRSYTTPGESTVMVTLSDLATAAQVTATWYQVRKKIDDIRASLPDGTVGPFFNDEFGDTYSIIYGFTADGFSRRELRDAVEDIRSQLLQVQDVAKIEVIGAQDERLLLEFSLQQLSSLRVDRNDLIRSLQAQNVVAPAGQVRTPDERILLRVSGGFASERDLLAVNFVANGKMFRLSDIGRVRRTYVDPPKPIFRVNGTEALGLAISMRESGNVQRLGENVAAAMQEIVQDLPVGIEPHLVANQPVIVTHAIGEFLKSLWEAIAIVMLVSFLSLGLRAGAVVALSIPLVLAATFVAMDLCGIDFQRVSLGALIISLGLLVDDAMITVEMMVKKLEEGCDVATAATTAYVTTHFPMGTGTLVTIAAFLPIGTAKSAAGEYTFSLFAVVALSLVISWFVAAIFTPLIGVVLLKAPKGHGTHGPGLVVRAFRRVLLVVMRLPRATVVATLALFGLSLAGMALVPQQFFPPSDRPELLVDLRFADSASIYTTTESTARLDALLAKEEDVESWSTYVGQGAVRFYLPLNVQLANEYFGQAVVVSRSIAARERLRARLAALMPETFPEAVWRIYPLELGPPVGWPMQYRVSGPDPVTVRDLALRFAGTLAADPRLRNVNFDWVDPTRTVEIKVDQDQARLLGVSSETLSQFLNTVVSGITITQVRDRIYLLDVVARASDEERVSLSSLKTLQIPLPNGRTAPLMQIAAIGFGQEFPVIWRRNRQPTLTINAEPAPGYQPEAVALALRPALAAFQATLPPGYRAALGGVPEESAKSQASVAAVLPLMLLLLTTILMVQLHSFQKLFLVVSVAPLGLIGVVGALLLFNKSLGFVALLGVVALIGMIVRNSVVLMVQIDAERDAGAPPWDAVVEACTDRFRPIMLTAAAAILGMIPIASTVFWGPMAYAIIGGLAMATVLTLIFLPALYVIWFRIRPPKPDAEPAR